MIHEVSMFDLLILEDEIESNPKVGTMPDAISFSDSIRASFLSDSFVDTLPFSDQIALASNLTWDRTLSESLVFSEDIHHRRHLESFEDFLFIFDWLEIVEFHSLDDTLVFSDSMIGDAGAGLLDSLVFSDSLDYVAITIHVFSDTLVWDEGLSTYFNDPWRPMVPIVPEVP